MKERCLMKYISLKHLIFMFIILTVPFSINAVSCEEEKANADKVEVDYELFMNEADFPYFRIKLNNVSNDIYVLTDYGVEIENNEYTRVATNTLQVIELPVYSRDNSCSNPLRKITVNLPLYNEFSDYKICEGIEDYKYCQKLIDEDLTHESLRQRITNFRNEMSDERNLEDYSLDEALVLSETEEEKSLDILFLVLTSIIILLTITLVIVIIIYKRKRKHMVI